MNFAHIPSPVRESGHPPSTDPRHGVHTADAVQRTLLAQSGPMWVGGMSSIALAACGGGDDSPVTMLMALPSGHRPDLLALPTDPTGNTPVRDLALAVRAPTPDELMNWAEGTYATVFPGHSSNVVSGALTYRAYANGNYLGVSGADVLVLGPVSGNLLVTVGTLNGFSNAVFGTANPLSAADAARFLGQAAFGGTDADVAGVQTLGFDAWVNAQFAAVPTQTHWDWMVAEGYAVVGNTFNFSGVDNTLWRKLMSSGDVLRQRVTLALSEVFVVSMAGLPVNWRGMVAAAYMDTLEANAFGNFRTLLNDVTLSVGMGVYLNMRGNQKADGKGREPDENYAREVMQLFTLGLYQLNTDGSVKTANGVPLETYTQDDIKGLARVFTGWDYDRYSAAVPDHARRPMVFTASRHSPEAKTFLGVNLPAGTDGVGELKTALDALFNHANVGPFFGRQLIQRLVTSNPSPAYVSRVATVFNNNGAGVRGDMKAVIRAVLLDAEARSTNPAANWGKVREPMVRMVQWARTFNVTSPLGLWNVGDMSSASTRLGQSPLRAPSVFNFFRPGYVPPGTSIGSAGLQAPEFQITNESTVVGYANWMQTVVGSGVGEVKGTYTDWLPLATDAGALFDKANVLLTAGQLSAATRATVTGAVASMAVGTDAQKLNRVYATVWLVMCSPEYIVQK